LVFLAAALDDTPACASYRLRRVTAEMTHVFASPPRGESVAVVFGAIAKPVDPGSPVCNNPSRYTQMSLRRVGSRPS
jgi:hypothetical protein